MANQSLRRNVMNALKRLVMKSKYFLGVVVVSTAMLLGILLSCEDKLQNTTYYVSDELTIIQTLDQSPELYSTYIALLKKVGFYTSLHSYGSYTCLVPPNAVLDPYIKERWGVNSVDELVTEEQLKEVNELVRFHTVAKARTTASYVEGRMPDTTYTGDFLTTSYLEGKGKGNIMINREAKFIDYDISANNGIIHSIDAVLTPYSDAIPKTMEKRGKHTIFVEALKLTGLDSLLSILNNSSGGKQNYTVLAESDSVFALSGINTIEDLIAEVADSSDFKNETNGLYRFMAYHAASTFMYSADFPEEAFISTVLPKNAWKINKTLKELKINYTESIGDWISLVIENSNIPAKNGVYHTIDTVMNIYVPEAKHIIFDVVSDQPEYQAKLIASHEQVTSDFWQNINWYPPTQTTRYLQMSKNINLNYNVMDESPACIYYEYKTPIIPKGKYEFLICSNGGNSARGIVQVYWDGNPIGSVYDLRTKASSVGFPDSAAMELNGWRNGYKWITNAAGDNAYDNGKMRRIITKELLCPEQGEHWVRMVFVKSGNFPLDYFEWIPVVD